ncbi:hypothetical protein M885DRAFT_507211 [Pelagophyceae sp. CCMP2097]|nr:hypothetical protein M885DRAFT_507211 [Pelagophyceae sp. CCMP2097]
MPPHAHWDAPASEPFVYARERTPLPGHPAPPEAKLLNGHGVATSQYSASFIGRRVDTESAHRKLFNAAAAAQRNSDSHYPSKQNRHMQTGYPSTICRLDPKFPLQHAEPQTQTLSRRTAHPSFASTAPGLSQSMTSEYAATRAQRQANHKKAGASHIEF